MVQYGRDQDEVCRALLTLTCTVIEKGEEYDCVCLREVSQLHNVCEQECECMNVHAFLVSVNGSINEPYTGMTNTDKS